MTCCLPASRFWFTAALDLATLVAAAAVGTLLLLWFWREARLGFDRAWFRPRLGASTTYDPLSIGFLKESAEILLDKLIGCSLCLPLAR